MKLENEINEIDKIQIAAEQKKRLTKLGSIKPKQGHTLFEINLIDKTIEKAQFISKQVVMTENGYGKQSSVIVKQNCIYISALNKKNALKKFNQK